ncbi:MAG: hypothetical protein EOM13_07670 [Clostridia bacterium]|nr:hypothetical protein [Clostridia bacterium]
MKIQLRNNKLPLIGGSIICVLVMLSLLIDSLVDAHEWQIVQTQPDPSGQVESAHVSGASQPLSQPSDSGVDADEKRMIPIHLVGAVCQPGIYHIPVGSYLFELLDQAGGLSEDAASEQINLALRLDVNQQIYIPTREEALNHPGLLPTVPQNDQDRAPLLDLNTANQAEFEQLPGIGPVTARAIVDYREEHGVFSCCEDLMLVPGIKESRFAALEDYIYVNSAG